MLRKNQHGGVVAITQDGGAGSSGKGCLNSYLTTHFPWDAAICNWQPNAGHYVTLDNGDRHVTQQVPSSFINPNVMLMIGAGSAICIDTLLAEVKRLDEAGFNVSERLLIHPNAAVITEDCKEQERRELKHGSTFKGCGAVVARKAMRLAKLAKECEELELFIHTHFAEDVLDMLGRGANFLVEGAQGVDLDLNHSQYPHCTSRQTVPGQIATDCGIPMNFVSQIVLNWRTYPIRISNESAADGSHRYSGDCFGAPEITWRSVAERAGYTYEEFMDKYGAALLTTVTKKERRVFEFPRERADFVWRLCGGSPGNDFVINSLNFVNFVDRNASAVDHGMTDQVKEWLIKNWSPHMLGALRWVRWGERINDCAEFSPLGY